ncbi:hypothetical protein SLA2020_488060 [Shorea laevis]
MATPTFPNSLAAQVLKEKYFPNSSFLEASLGNRPSYAWRSICKSRPLLEEGLIWRVGNGASIKIWGDKWIPRATTHKIQSPVHILHEDTTVSALIDAESHWWNTTLIQHVFSPVEAQSIAVWPLAQRVSPTS